MAHPGGRASALPSIPDMDKILMTTLLQTAPMSDIMTVKTQGRNAVMQITVYEKPCLILEAAELVYAVVNRIPATRLTEKSPYCIPVDAVRQILQDVCRDLDAEDPELRFFFGGFPLGEDKNKEDRLACVARCMIGVPEPIGCYSVEEARAVMRQSIFAKGCRVHILGIGVGGISAVDVEQYTNLGQEFGKMPIPDDYRIRLVEAFSAYNRHADRLCDILTPIAERLKPALEPWVRNAAPLMEQWRQVLFTDQGQKMLLKRCNVIPEELDRIQIGLRYFSPAKGHGNYDVDGRTIQLHVGVAVAPSRTKDPEDNRLAENEYATLRLLANPDRLAMLRAMTKKAMSTQELAQELGLNAGSVFRDLNNLYNAGVLNLDVAAGRNYYTTNLQWIDRLTSHLMRYLKQDGES